MKNKFARITKSEYSITLKTKSIIFQFFLNILLILFKNEYLFYDEDFKKLV